MEKMAKNWKIYSKEALPAQAISFKLGFLASYLKDTSNWTVHNTKKYTVG